MTAWSTRPETAADVPAIREVVPASFPTALEADLVDALRADPPGCPDCPGSRRPRTATSPGTRC